MNNQDRPLPGEQTEFVDQAVLFQEQVQPARPMVSSNQKPKQKAMLIVVSLTTVLFLVVLIIAILSSRRMNQQQGITPSPSPFDQSQALTPIQVRLKEARSDLDLADPTDNLLPFPPVSGGIRIIDKKR